MTSVRGSLLRTYARFANLVLPIIRGLLLGMTWPVTKLIVYLLPQNVGTYYQILINKTYAKNI